MRSKYFVHLRKSCGSKTTFSSNRSSGMSQRETIPIWHSKWKSKNWSDLRKNLNSIITQKILWYIAEEYRCVITSKIWDTTKRCKMMCPQVYHRLKDLATVKQFRHIYAYDYFYLDSRKTTFLSWMRWGLYVGAGEDPF